jgi:hypothetical protein
MKLTKEQKSFLNKHSISVDMVMDASEMRASSWKAFIKGSQYIVAINVAKCAKSGHQMRSHGGHCVMCNPATLAFQKRHSSDGEIYIMYSYQKKLIKVGVAASSEERESSVNEAGYGNIKDWKLKYFWQIENSGALEKKVQKMLKKYRVLIGHNTGNSNFASEIFSCPIKKAKEIIELVIN